MTVKHCAFLAVLLAALTGSANTLAGRVVGVHDGDTLTVLDATNGQHKVRLAGIDAPELGQPFGENAKKALSEKVFNQAVSVKWSTRDFYGRLIGNVRLGSRWINLEMVAEGWAWAFDKYSPKHGSEAQILTTVQEGAREARAGVWSTTAPVPPWEWRKKNSG